MRYAQVLHQVIAAHLMLLSAAACAQAPAPHVLVKGTLRLSLDRTSAVVRSLSDTGRGLTLAPADRQGEAFRLILRGSDNRIATIRSGVSPVTGWEASDERATAIWSGPLRDDAGVAHDIAVRVTCVLTASQGGPELRIRMSLENRSDQTILEAWLPTVGGLSALGGEVAASNPANRRPLALPFGDFAPHYPGAMPMAFVDIGGPTGLYFGAYEKLARLKLLRVMEQDGDIAARVTHLPFVKPGGRFSSCAAVYRFHSGGHAGAGSIYRRWFVRTFGIKDPGKDWIRRQSFFQMTMIMLPEGNIHYRFRDVPRLAADARKYGVEAIQLAGWQRGGHDGGYPYYEPDPRLGTWEDLRKAVAACHRMGVKVFFFVNLQVTMLDIEWYRKELHAYAAQSESGAPFWIAGWGMGTLASRMGLTTPTMAFLDPAFPRFADALLAYYRKLAEIGADGVHIDKMFPAALNANPRSPLPPDTSTWEGAIRFIARMDRECRAINPEWRISLECSWDRVLQFGTATWWAGNMSAVRSVFPETLETVGLYQPYDFQGVNNAVRDGHAVMVAPFHFQRSMDEPAWRDLARYIRDVKKIRDALSDTVFLGESWPTADARIGKTAGSAAFRVYRNPRTDRRVCIASSGDAAVSFVFQGWTKSASQAVRVHVPGRPPVTLALPATVEVPPERLAFVEEMRPVPQASRLPKPHVAQASRLHVRRPFANADFENGTLEGWTADPNWAVDDNSAGGWYSGWHGSRFAWSGKGGEPRVGKLRSPGFRLDARGVEIGVAGWSDIQGQSADRWNYVTLNLADGRELDRVYTPNTTHFVSMALDGGGHRGENVYIEAVDDGPADTYSMICIDDIRLWDPAEDAEKPLRPVPGAIVLENNHYRVEVGRANGTIARILDKASGQDLIRERRLSDNWRVSLPVRDAVSSTTHGSQGRLPESWRNHEGNYIQGRLQRLSSHDRLSDGLSLRWAGRMRADDGRLHRIAVAMRIRAVGDALRFETRIENESGFELGEVYAPIIGGVHGLGRSEFERRRTELIVPQQGRFASDRPFQTFASMSWLGVFGPERFYAYPTGLDAPWGILAARRGGRSVYFGAHDPVARLKALHLEMLPGVSGVRSSGNWPTREELQGRPAGVRMSWAHLAYHQAHTPFDASPVVLRCASGGSAEAAAYYTSWFRTLGRAPAAEVASASRQVGRVPFADLKAAASEAAASGQTSLTLSDWRAEGPDTGVPLLEPDPALGGWAGLKEAAGACRELGVGLILQARINPVATTSELFRNVLRRCQCIDRWGVPQTVLGWGAPRVTAEALSAGERRVYVNTGHPGFRAWIVEAIERIAEAGAAGVHLRGFFPGVLDFNPTAGAGPDRAGWEGALVTLRAIRDAAQRHAPGFRILVDEPRDHFTIHP